MYEPGTSGAPESVRGSRYTVCGVDSVDADVVIFAMRLMREVIGAIGWLVNNGRKCNRDCCRLMIDKIMMRTRSLRIGSSLSRSVRDYIQQLSFLHKIEGQLPSAMR
jgi:hypothetical protein